MPRRQTGISCADLIVIGTPWILSQRGCGIANEGTVRITTDDSFDTEPAQQYFVSNTTYSITLITAKNTILTAATVPSGVYTLSNSGIIPVQPNNPTRLQLLVPGEFAVPGSLTGKRGLPTQRQAGVGFAVTVIGVVICLFFTSYFL